eukprot:g7268.t1
MNLLGWDKITNFEGVEAREELHYSVHAAKRKDQELYETRKFDAALMQNLTYEEITYGENSPFGAEDPLRLVQTSDAEYSNPNSNVKKYFIQGDYTLFFFKMGAYKSADPDKTQQFSGALKGLTEEPEPPVFQLQPQPFSTMPFAGDKQLVFTAEFTGKPRPSVTWVKNGVNLDEVTQSRLSHQSRQSNDSVWTESEVWPKLCRDGDSRFTCPRINTTYNEVTLVYTTRLEIPILERNHTGAYEVHLENFAVQKPVASPPVTLEMECQECTSCDPESSEDRIRGECICNSGQYRSTESLALANKLGFECTPCGTGWNCSLEHPNRGVDTLATVHTEQGYWRRSPTDYLTICMCRFLLPHLDGLCAAKEAVENAQGEVGDAQEKAEAAEGMTQKMDGAAAKARDAHAFASQRVKILISWQKVYERDEAFGLQLGQLYLGYVHPVWFWEVVEMLRKLGKFEFDRPMGRGRLVTIGCVVCALYILLTSVQLNLTLIMALYLEIKAREQTVANKTAAQDKIADLLLMAVFGLSAGIGMLTFGLNAYQNQLKKFERLKWVFEPFPRAEKARIRAEMPESTRLANELRDAAKA